MFHNSEEVPLNISTAYEKASVDANQGLPSEEHIDCFVEIETNVDTGMSILKKARTRTPQTKGSEKHEGASDPTLTTTAETHVTPAENPKEDKGVTGPTKSDENHDTQAKESLKLAQGRNVNDGTEALSDKPDDVSFQQTSRSVGAAKRTGATSPTEAVKGKTQGTQVRTESTAARQGLAESKTTSTFRQDCCEKLYNSMRELNNCNKCLELISKECPYEWDNLQTKTVIEPHSCLTFEAMDVRGFEAYAIPGEDTMDLYILVSHLLCGNEDWKNILQCATARFAITNFESYVQKLMDEFKSSKTPLIDANIFFEIHGICFKEFTLPLKETSVSLALDNLVHNIVISGRTGPFDAELLSGVLNCNIIQHFENNRYHDRDVRTTPGLRLFLKSSSSCDRELHIYWRKSASYPHSYRIIPLFKADEQTHSKMVNIPIVERLDGAIIDKITAQESNTWRKSFEVFADSHSVVFDELKDMDINKPDRKVRTIDVPGYKAYEKPGDQITSVYEWISHLLCGDESLKYILRLAAARYAMKHFETYVTKMTDKFNDFYEAKVFFAAHDITGDDNEPKHWRKNKRKWVSDRFDKLVRETVNEGKGNAPFYVEFLSGVLNRKITQHFEEKKYSGRTVNSIAGLDVTLTTESSSSREMHMYWMRSEKNSHPTYRIVPLFKCVPSSTGMELCGDVYTLLKNQELFEPTVCLDMIHKTDIYAFEQLKGHAIIKPDPNVLRIIKRINVQGYIAYEKPGHETTCLYELMGYLLFGNADMKYILRLAAIRYALQNVGKYVEKLIDEFEDTTTKVNNAKTFFEIHNIEFKESEQSSMGKGVWMAFADLLRETVNTGQGPFYVDFLSGALNCKINQYFEKGLYNQEVKLIRGLNVKLTTSTPPERELHIYRMKTSEGQSNTHKIVALFKK